MDEQRGERVHACHRQPLRRFCVDLLFCGHEMGVESGTIAFYFYSARAYRATYYSTPEYISSAVPIHSLKGRVEAFYQG